MWSFSVFLSFCLSVFLSFSALLRALYPHPIYVTFGVNSPAPFVLQRLKKTFLVKLPIQLSHDLFADPLPTYDFKWHYVAKPPPPRPPPCPPPPAPTWVSHIIWMTLKLTFLIDLLIDNLHLKDVWVDAWFVLLLFPTSFPLWGFVGELEFLCCSALVLTLKKVALFVKGNHWRWAEIFVVEIVQSMQSNKNLLLC